MPRRADSVVDPTGATAAWSAVLAVDEDAVMRKLVRRILESAGFGCVEAADGESGLKLAVEVGVSAAVVDLILPGMSGAELAWRLCEEIPGLPVVAVSGRLDLWDTDDLKDLGIREVLPKPLQPKKLVRAVADALAHPPVRVPSGRPEHGGRRPPARGLGARAARAAEAGRGSTAADDFRRVELAEVRAGALSPRVATSRRRPAEEPTTGSTGRR